MREGVRSIVFLAVMALVVGNGLAAISRGLQARIDNNRQMLRVRSLMEVMAGAGGHEQSDDELLEEYREHVVELEGELRVYVYREGGRETAYAFELEGRGLWDRIKGFAVVEADKVTVRGVRFYEQNETPGLGGEIGTEMFAGRFVGKKLRAGEAVLRVVKPGSVSELGDTQVNGITGATLTCEAVNRLMAEAIGKFLGDAEQDR